MNTEILKIKGDWQEADVLDYAEAERIPMNPLYCEGFKRVGCVGCPMAGKSRTMEFNRYPKIKAAYIRAFERMLEERTRRAVCPICGIWPATSRS